MEMPKVVSREAALGARKELLVKEKAWNRQRDALSAERRKLPMVRMEKDYPFEGPNGRRTLGDLFEGRRQLIVYTSCSTPPGMRGARPAPSSPTTSRDRSCTSPRATPRSR